MPTTNERSLIVMADDDPDFMLVVRTWLAHWYDFVGVRNGEEFLEAMEDLDPALVILDITMPGPDGLTLCAKIRGLKRFASLPILFLTSSSKDEDFIKGWEVGGTSYLTKPIDRTELREVVNNLLAEPQ